MQPNSLEFADTEVEAQSKRQETMMGNTLYINENFHLSDRIRIELTERQLESLIAECHEKHLARMQEFLAENPAYLDESMLGAGVAAVDTLHFFNIQGKSTAIRFYTAMIKVEETDSWWETIILFDEELEEWLKNNPSGLVH